MQQAEFNRAVARARGESISTIKRLGFLLADVSAEIVAGLEPGLDPELDTVLERPVIDWDDYHRIQRVAVSAAARSDVPVVC